MNPFELFYLSMLAIFLGVEIWAVKRKAPNDTFSEFVWRFTKHNAAKFTLAGFLLWLALHFLFGPSKF